MKIYNAEDSANFDATIYKSQYISKICPFHVRMSTRTCCGSWCPHFFISNVEGTSEKKQEVYITCSGQEVRIGFVEN
jgi:hypothetical protein